MTTMTTETAPRVWIACLACYNDGRLVGDWFSAEIADDITLAEVHAHYGGERLDCEELWCFDSDGLPISREMSPTEAGEWGRLLAELDEWQRDAFRAWVRAGDYSHDGDGLPSVSDFLDAYAGDWDSFEDYAQELFIDRGYSAELPERLAPYFDMSAWARDLAYDYTTEPSGHGSVFIFRCL